MKIKLYQVVFSFFMALLMTCVVTLTLTIVHADFHNNGHVPYEYTIAAALDSLGRFLGSMMLHDIVQMWLDAWKIAFLVAFPTAVLVVPVVRRICDRLIRV